MNITLQIFLRVKNLYLKLSLNNITIVLIITLLVLCSEHLHSASIEFGKEGESYSIQVDEFNKNLRPASNLSNKNQKIKSVSTSSPVKSPNFIEKHLKKIPIIFIEADKIENNPKSPVSINKVLQPEQTGGISLTGKGTKEIIALSDGTFDIQVYLSTYNKAFLKASLYDSDGSEIWFKGQSLLSWERSDDSQNDPLSFKGQIDQASMHKEKSGDYSPALNLSYKVDIKEGQKIVLTTGGEALPKSYIKIKGNCF